MRREKNPYHDWKEDGCLFDVLDDPEADQTGELDAGKEVDPEQGHSTQVGQVGLVFLGHKEQEETVEELPITFTFQHGHINEI